MVTDLIRGKPVEQAQQILRFALKKGSHPVKKLLDSAVANAKQKFLGEASNLYIAKILVNEGPKLKRFRPRARGQSYQIQKKTSHITLVLEELKPTKPAEIPAVPKKEEKPLEAAAPAVVAKKESSKPLKPRREEGRAERTIRRLPKIFRRKVI